MPQRNFQYIVLVSAQFYILPCTWRSASFSHVYARTKRRNSACRAQEPDRSLSLHRDTFAEQTMRWPWSGDDDDRKKDGLWARAASLQSIDWSTTFTEPRILVPSLVLTISSIAGVRLYKAYLRRIPTVNHIKPDYFRRRSLFGQVTSVGDADNFRLFHTPGGRIAGWGWLPWKRVPTKREDLSKQTVSTCIRNTLRSECFGWRFHFLGY